MASYLESANAYQPLLRLITFVLSNAQRLHNEDENKNENTRIFNTAYWPGSVLRTLLSHLVFALTLK